MKKNKLLILGLGSIGQRYFEIIKNIKNIEIKTFDKNKKVKSDFNNFKKFIKNKSESALICLPTNLHLRYIPILIDKGYKFILVEKPLSNSFRGIDKIKKLINKYNVKLFVVTNLRYHPGIKYLKSNIKKVGKIFFTKAYFYNNTKNMYGKKYNKHYSSNHNLGGGVLFDACHEVDYLKYLIGPIQKSKSTAYCHKNKKATDIFSAVIFHKNKITSFINNNFLSNTKKRGCEIYGSKGILKWSSEGRPGEEKISVKFISNNNKSKLIYRKNKFDHNEPYKNQILEFEKMKERKKYNMSNFDDSLDTLNVILKTKIYGLS